MSRRENAGFREYKVVVGLDQKGKTDEEVMKTVPVSGELTRLFYENPRDRSPQEIFANYKEGLVLSPARTNRSEDGKSQNRRVETSATDRPGGIRVSRVPAGA